MDGGCGLRLSVYYYYYYAAAANQQRFYPEPPYHMCSYHGVETDLVNLTSCVGYELWRFSTTCTLVLESVKATSVIFLLGVGSFVCYRLYHRYKRRGSSDSNNGGSSSSPPSPNSRPSGSGGGRRKRPRLIHWVSREVLDSGLSRDEDFSDIKSEYFGPNDQSDDSSPPSGHCDVDGLLVHFIRGYEKSRSLGIVSRHRMGHTHSSIGSNTYEPVAYNIHSGVQILSPNIQEDTRHVMNNESQLTLPRYKRPNSLPLRCRRTIGRLRRSEADGCDGNRILVVPSLFASKEGSCGDSDSMNSSCDVDSPRVGLSDEEDGDDEGGDDDESFLLHSGCKTDEDLHSRSESMMANFSPGSLLNRQMTVSPILYHDDDRKSLEDLHSEKNVPPKQLRKTVFLVHESSNSSSSSSDSLDPLEKRDTIDFVFHSEHDDEIGRGGGGGGGGKCKKLPRDASFGSECSELSVDTSCFNTIGNSTQAKIDLLQLEIDSVKQDCHDLESYMGNVTVHGPTPAIYTELVKSTLSDGSEGSDVATSLDNESSRRHIANKRAAFRSARMTPEKDTSLDRQSSASSSRAANSVNLSLEWDSMKCSSGGEGCDNNISLVTLQKRLGHVEMNSSSNKGSATHGDSGSDFGTPLTNGSPEPSCTRKRSGSVASLEWDEEFPRLEADTADAEVFLRGSTAVVEERKGIKRTMSQSLSKDHCRVISSSCDISPIVFSPSATSLAVCDHKRMWSSMESGYIDEYSESSRQVSPQDSVTTTSSNNLTPSMHKTNGQSSDFARRDGNCQSVDTVRTWPVVGPKVTVREFGHSSKSVRKEFHAEFEHLHSFKHLRLIHDDRYCVLRAVLLQSLFQGFSILEHSGGVDQVKKKLGTLMRYQSPWLRKWNFARRIKRTKDDCLGKMLGCVQSLDWLVNCVLSSSDREHVAVDMLNCDPELDVQAMEGMKLLLICSAIDLYEAMSVDKPVPEFVSHLYCRETSSTPEAFLVNHLNGIGNTCNIGPMELMLLGQTLGITVCIINSSKESQGEFVSYYPDCNLGSRPKIYLTSEDGHRFGIVVK